MAAATFAERLNLDLTLLIADQALIDLSRQQDATATQNTSRTTRVCQMAAAKVESRLGPAGAYDDTDATIGDQIFLDFGIRLALYYYSQVYTFVLKEAGVAYIGSIREEIDEHREMLVQAAILGQPTVVKVDNDALNKRRPNSTWGSTSDPADPPEV